MPIIGDVDVEGDETFTVTLSNETGNATIVDNSGTGTIADDDTPPVGLSQRPSNTTCIAPDRPTVASGVDSEDPFPASPGFNLPTKILQAPGDGSRWFVLELPGRVQVFDTASPGTVDEYVDITASVNGASEGLLGMAFPPDFPTTPEIYLYYVSGTGGARESRLSRIVLDDTDNPVNVTEEIILTIDQFAANHNGGDIAFGNDGYLYLGLGDGGGGGDPQETGQDTTNLLGAMLRVDVDGVAFPSPGYNIPGTNPFSGNAKCGPTQTNANDCPEIYAWGFRNPFRWNFDPPTGDLWLGDVGQSALEEIDIVELNGNYGWDCREGTNNFELAGCPAGGFVDPVAEYSQSGAQSVTGGVFYRGTGVPDLTGRYVFADFESGRIYALTDNGDGTYDVEEQVDTFLRHHVIRAGG